MECGDIISSSPWLSSVGEPSCCWVGAPCTSPCPWEGVLVDGWPDPLRVLQASLSNFLIATLSAPQISQTFMISK
jgi:hypothetical protein